LVGLAAHREYGGDVGGLPTFARDEGIDGDHRAVVVLDRAGWRTGSKLVLPEGIDVIFLPPASPELQPAERLWAVLDEPVANRASSPWSASRRC